MSDMPNQFTKATSSNLHAVFFARHPYAFESSSQLNFAHKERKTGILS